MAGLYPNLEEKFHDENICPICYYEMEGAPKYSCVNCNKYMCHRCKPYYYACPICQSQLNLIMESHEGNSYQPPPASHFMAHPYSPYPADSQPSAPFLDNERVSWEPPVPTHDQELYPCKFFHLGCYARVPEYLRTLHETRCPYRSEFEETHSSNDFNSDEGVPEPCKYQVVGCNVNLSEWRRLEHEKICIYKDRMRDYHDDLHENLESLNIHDDSDGDNDDPEEMIDCKFKDYGCMVRMPRRKGQSHVEQCNYRKYHEASDEEEICYVSEPDVDLDEQVPCCWAEYGCRVQPKLYRRETHEDNCNYRREHCRFVEFGCSELIEPSRKFVHEKHCKYAC